jgi:hypothetical protein
MLIRIDPATGNATQIATITGTPDNEGDNLLFINGTLYLVDSSPVSYTLSTEVLELHPTSETLVSIMYN